MKTIGKILKGLGIAFVLLIVLAMCTPSDKKEDTAKKEEPVQEQTTVEEAKPEETQTADTNATLEIYRLLLDDKIKDNFEGYESEVKDNTLFIKAWSSGVAMAAASAKTGDSASKEAWDKLVEATVSSCQTTYDAIQTELKLKDAHVSFNVLNDVDTTKTLISVLDGVLVYNALSE